MKNKQHINKQNWSKFYRYLILFVITVLFSHFKLLMQLEYTIFL